MFKNLKEEKIAIPALMLLVELLRQIIFSFNPQASIFIPETELLIFVVKFWQFLWISSGVWVLMRIVFPQVHKYLSQNLYEEFNHYAADYKIKISLYLFGLFLIAFTLLFNGANGQSLENDLLFGKTKETALRLRLVDTLEKQLYVRELTGNNDGIEVERYLKHVGLPKGYSWCAAYVSYNLSSYNVANPKSARAANFYNKSLVTKKPLPGDVFTLYYSNLGRIGHTGFVVGKTHGYQRTNEGNTGTGGIREGSGVHSYLRPVKQIYSITNYISPKFKTNEQIHSILDIAFNAGLQQNTNLVDRKAANERFYFYSDKRELQGHNFNCESRYEYFQNKCSWSGGYSEAKNGECKAKDNCRSEGWSAYSYNHLQRFGVATETVNYRNRKLQIATKQMGKGKGKNSKTNKTNYNKGDYFSLVYKDTSRFRMYFYRCNSNCNNKKIDHCWLT